MNVSLVDDDPSYTTNGQYVQSILEERSQESASTASNDASRGLVAGEERPHSADSGAGDRHGRLLLAALLENFCKLYESNPKKSERLFSVLCKTLSSMGILDQENVVELSGIRSQYSRAFKQLMLKAKEAVDSEDRVTNTLNPQAIQFAKLSINSGDSSGDDSTNGQAADKTDIFATSSSGSRLSLAEWLGYEDSKYYSEFQELKLLGKGGFGAVYHARHRIDGMEYAVKKISLRRSSLNQAKIYREIKTLARLEHPNVIRYFSSWLEHSTNFTSKNDSRHKGGRSLDTRDSEHDGMLFMMDHEEPSFSTRNISEIEDIDDSGGIVFEASDNDEAEGHDALSALSFHREFRENHSRLRHDSRSSAGTDSSNQTQTGAIDSLEQESSSMPSTSRLRNEFCSGSIESIPRPGDSIFSASLPHRHGKFNRKRRRKSESSVGLTLFIQMHLCPTTLRDHIRARNRAYCDMESFRERLSSHSYIGLFRAILEGANHVHRCGLCHRDIKPSNVFLSQVDRSDSGAIEVIDTTTGEVSWVIPKIGDFGLVLPTGGDLEMDADEEDGVGTAIYAAPEQFSRLLPSQMTSKCDVFALGIVFFEMLHYSTNTAMERSKLLSDLRHGVLPDDFVQSHTAEAVVILAMTCADPVKRPSVEEILEMEILVTAEEKEKDKELARIKQENAELRKRIQELEGISGD